MIIDSPIISGSYAASGSLNQLGNVVISGSLTVTGDITGSAANATSASFAISASNARTASFAPLYLPLAGGTMTGDISGAGRTFTFQYLVLGSGTTQGRISTDGGKNIEFYPTNTVQSTRFWANGNVKIQTGGTYVDDGFKLDVSGSGRYTNGLTVTGSLNVSGSVTGSLLGTASFANNTTSASYAATASYISGSGGGVGFPFSGSAVITGSLLITELSGSGVRYLTTDNNGLIVAQTASAAIKQTQAFTSSVNQTSFTIANGYTTGLVDVFINGTKLAPGVEFTDTTGTVITLATGSNSGDLVEFVKYFPASGVTNNALRQQTTFTASAGQTVFSASYTPGLLDIFYNGSRLSNNEYTANNGTFFTLATGSVAGDILDVLVYSYQVGAFSGIGGQGVATQVAYFGTTNAITGSPNFTISGSTMTVTGSLIVSGSGTFTNIGPAVFSGSLTSTAGFTGSFSGTATSASNAATASFVLTAQTASFIANAQSASYVLNAVSSSFATSAVTASYADSLTVAGTLTAQTLVVQTITSSVDFVTGSTRFGSILGNTHQFTGSVSMTGSLAVVTTGTEFQVTNTGVNFGNVIGDAHNITGSVGISGSLSGTSATFTGALTTGGVIISNGTQFRVYNTGNGDYGNLTFATATGFTFDKGATFSSSVKATTLALGSVDPSTNGIYLNNPAANGANYGYIKTNAVTFNTTSLILGSTYGYSTPVDALTIYNGTATFASNITLPGNINYTSGDGGNWYINPPANGPTIRLKYHGGSTDRSGGLGWINNSGERTEALTWQDTTVTFNGYVTSPAQPAFRAYYSTNGIWNLANNATFIFDLTEYNIGSCYNTSNGRFTAPVAGVYQFNFYSIVLGAYNNAAISFRKNGGAPTSGYNIHFSPTATGYWSNVVYTTSLYLNAGDYVYMINNSGYNVDYHGDDWSSFSGYLVG